MCLHIPRKKSKKAGSSAVDCLLDMDKAWVQRLALQKEKEKKEGNKEGEERREEIVIISNITVFLLMHFYAS